MLAIEPYIMLRTAWLWRRFSACLRSTRYITQGLCSCVAGSRHACDRTNTLYKDRVALAEALPMPGIDPLNFAKGRVAVAEDLVMLAIGPLHYARTAWLRRRLWSCLRPTQHIILGLHGCGGGSRHAVDRPNTVYKGCMAWRGLWSCLRSTEYMIQGLRGSGGGLCPALTTLYKASWLWLLLEVPRATVARNDRYAAACTHAYCSGFTVLQQADALWIERANSRSPMVPRNRDARPCPDLCTGA